MSRKTDASSPSGGLQVATGTYTGDGAATQAIVGVGFQPRFIMIYPHSTIAGVLPWGLRADVDGLNASFHWAGGVTHRYATDEIISLDVDGFTVGDGTGSGVAACWNNLNIIYSYMCFR